MTSDNLKVQYSDVVSRAERLRATLIEQIAKLLSNGDIPLAVPLESRVKAWSSIEEKIQLKSLSLKTITALPDLVGLRIILLFREDLERVDKIIRDSFDVLSSEDKASLLGDAQFGYQSLHYQVKLPSSWCKIPTMADLDDLEVEIQLRTIAQHIWAAASHKLQYKHEANVPPPIRRSINRVSALLETIDLEFDRVLAERRSYRQSEIKSISGSEPLNVDLLRLLLAEVFPAANLKGDEDYGDLLLQLSALSVSSVNDLKRILKKHREVALEADRREVSNRRKKKDFNHTTEERINTGVFYTLTGLARAALRAEFGGDVVDKLTMKSQKKKSMNLSK